jgi:hypothetical protein
VATEKFVSGVGAVHLEALIWAAVPTRQPHHRTWSRLRAARHRTLGHVARQ